MTMESVDDLARGQSKPTRPQDALPSVTISSPPTRSWELPRYSHRLDSLTYVVAGGGWGSGRGRGLSGRGTSRQSFSSSREPAVPQRASLNVSLRILKSV